MLQPLAALCRPAMLPSWGHRWGGLLGDGQVPGRGGAPGSSPGGRPGPTVWPQEGGSRTGTRCSAATARGTPLASSPSLSLVVRDLIRLACCWVMAMAMSPDGTADRGHHLVGGALCGLVPRSALQCCNRSRYPAGRQPQPLPGGARSDPVGVLLDHGQVPGRDGRQGHHLVDDPLRRPGPLGRVIVGRSTLQCCNRSRRSVGRRQDGMKGG